MILIISACLCSCHPNICHSNCCMGGKLLNHSWWCWNRRPAVREEPRLEQKWCVASPAPNGPVGVHRAGDKAGVGLVRPSATGSDRGHGSLGGFSPLLLCKHSEPPDWSGTPSNQEPPSPLRSSAAGSASARSFIGSSAPIFYMNQPASYAFFPCFLHFLRALL